MSMRCEPLYETSKSLYSIISLIYGAVVGITLVLYVEGLLSLWVTEIMLVLVVAPIVEEVGKTAIVVLAKCHRELAPRLVFWSALGFGLIEVFVHSMFDGVYILSVTFFMHIIFSLPTAYAYKYSPKLYPFGLVISILMHSAWNFMVLSLF